MDNRYDIKKKRKKEKKEKTLNHNFLPCFDIYIGMKKEKKKKKKRKNIISV